VTQGNSNVYVQYRGYINDTYYNLYFLNIFALWEERLDIDDQQEFDDTKGGIRIRKSEKNRQHNGKKKNDKRTNNDIQIHQYQQTDQSPPASTHWRQ
jgi:hypothetical protein